MAYSTGSYFTPDQLLSSIRAFAAANGWTENAYAADGAGYKLHINKGSVYLNFRSLNNELSTIVSGWPVSNATGVACAISTGYSGSSAWNQQPGHVFSSASRACSGIFNMTSSGVYHLFASTAPDMLFCVAEVATGIHGFIGGGMLDKVGAYTGGEWLTGSYALDGTIFTGSGNTDYMAIDSFNHHLAPLPFMGVSGTYNFPNTLIRADVDGYSGFGPITRSNLRPAWLTGALILSPYSFTSSQAQNNENMGSRWHFLTPNAFNSVTPMLPIHLFARRPLDSLSPIGHPPHLRWIKVTNYAPGQIISLGSEQWMVFPGYQKDATRYSYMYGYAVRYQP